MRLAAFVLVSACGISTALSAGTCVGDLDKIVIGAAHKPLQDKPLSGTLASKLDEAVKSALPLAAAPGFIVGVQTPGGSWKKGYGVSNPATGAPMVPGMHTRIGSVTKTFTGTIILQLAEAGRLSLDDTISMYVEGIPEGDRITLRQLANMTSGVASYTASGPFVEMYLGQPGKVFTPEELLPFAIELSPLFEPGAQYDYSNTNTILLGMVIEKVTSEPFETVLRSGILEPLGLKDTVWPGSQTDFPAPYAEGVTFQGNDSETDPARVATHWNPASLWTAGELISSIDDLLVYARALATGRDLLGPKMQGERLRSFGGPAGYGLALRCTGAWIGHTGEVPGYTTVIYYNGLTDTTVAIQANSDMPSGNCADAEEGGETAGNGSVSCSLPAMRIFNAVAPLLSETASGKTEQ
ncbi:beta-lactamase family protein [Labrenzia suaedae]|uniref:Beta-lactamase family protein n=2 Tax=Roseibium litorale TaxID=2803841 RepID=A0ABR9CQU7_9HYPH|nr:beta-lactamase family protein [Roseibium litorale]